MWDSVIEIVEMIVMIDRFSWGVGGRGHLYSIRMKHSKCYRLSKKHRFRHTI